MVEVRNMRYKAVILVTVCVTVAVLVIVLFETPAQKPAVQQASKDTTVIDGVSYSTRPTPFGMFTIRYFEFLPDGNLSMRSWTCWLLYFNESTPFGGSAGAEPSGTIQVPGPPPPWGDIMIDGWLYSQIPTNFIEFTLPPSTIKCWTETVFEPIPANAQIQRWVHGYFIFVWFAFHNPLALWCPFSSSNSCLG